MFDDPSALVAAFIADYFRWNDVATQRMKLSQGKKGKGTEEAWSHHTQAAKQEYAEVLSKYCRPGFQGESVAYGDLALHDPTCEVIVSAKKRGERCLVKTQMRQSLFNVVSVSNFEYRLAREDGRWYLESVKCVFEDGKYDSL